MHRIGFEADPRAYLPKLLDVIYVQLYILRFGTGLSNTWSPFRGNIIGNKISNALKSFDVVSKSRQIDTFLVEKLQVISLVIGLTISFSVLPRGGCCYFDVGHHARSGNLRDLWIGSSPGQQVTRSWITSKDLPVISSRVWGLPWPGDLVRSKVHLSKLSREIDLPGIL